MTARVPPTPALSPTRQPLGREEATSAVLAFLTYVTLLVLVMMTVRSCAVCVLAFCGNGRRQPLVFWSAGVNDNAYIPYDAEVEWSMLRFRSMDELGECGPRLFLFGGFGRWVGDCDDCGSGAARAVLRGACLVAAVSVVVVVVVRRRYAVTS